MNRGYKLITLLLISSALWITFFYFTSMRNMKEWNKLIVGLPSYALICFGCYALLEIGKGLAFLKDYPEEHNKMLDDIRRSHNYLGSKGLDLGS
mmetsp:Transcript_36560/g.56737  ORF Transcript_36560/g.56737 Transcript_36560/m.56737 type:complete len:94 (-) Transcript_36560:66-347(-)